MTNLNNIKTNREATIMNNVVEGTVSLDNLMAMENIDFLNVLNPIQLMQKIYNAESLVGAVTVVVGNICNVDVTKEAEFEEFKEKLMMLKGNKAHAPYGESIWVNGINVFMGFHFSTGHFYCYYVVTNAEMKAIEDKVKAMSKDKMTVQDALQLQSDLVPILRAWQESSIDCTKDKNKKFNYDFRKFFKKIDVVSTFCKKHADKIELNTKEVFQDPSKNNFKITLPSDNNDEVFSDLVGQVTEEIRTSAEQLYNGDLKDIYCLANMDAYKPFMGYAKENAELALFIKDIFSFCYNAINDKNAKLSKEDCETLRNVIYTKALELGVEFTDVVKVAIDTAMCTVKESKEYGIVVGNSDINAFSQYPVRNIFPREYQVALTNKPYMETIATEEDFLTLDRNITDGEEIEFVNGESTDGKIVLINEFTGVAVESHGVLEAPANVYAFEEVTAMMVYKTFDEKATGKNMVYDKNGSYLNKLVDNYNFSNIRVMGKSANGLRNDDHFIGVFRATRTFKTNEYITVEDVKSFEPRNGCQRLFLVICK